MRLDLSPDELLSTTRAVRKRLDFDRPVERSVIKECLELAVQAPTGSNAQGWRFLVVTDPGKRAAIAEHYHKGFTEYVSQSGGPRRGGDAEQQRRVSDSATYLADNFGRVPVMVIPCHPGRVYDQPDAMTASIFGSILPATWSFMLAARERGLGTAWTTIHLAYEREVAEILGIPYDDVTQCSLITVGYTSGTEFKPASRPPIETVTYWDTWGDEADFSEPA